jgi:hypothetical protein
MGLALEGVPAVTTGLLGAPGIGCGATEVGPLVLCTFMHRCTRK